MDTKIKNRMALTRELLLLYDLTSILITNLFSYLWLYNK